MNSKMRVLVAMAVVGLCGRVASASTFNTQKFTFISRTGPDPTFWIGEDIGGACESSQLLQVSIVKDRAMLIRSSLGERQKDWKWLVSQMNRFSAEKPIELANVDGKWRTKGVTWFVESPEPNEQLVDAFGKHILAGGDNGITWNKKMGSKGVVLPTIDGFEAEMTYCYPAGFYVNYDIAKAYYFPKTGYLLVFTDQKRRAVGMDTMHGFILMRRTK